VGVPLFSASGDALGIMIAMYRSPVAKVDFAESILQIFSARVGSEIERQRSERSLRENEERIRNYFQLGLIGMAITSPEKVWLQVNDQLCEFFGYPEEELTGMTWTELTHPDDVEENVGYLNQVLRGEIDGYSMEKRYIHKDGQIIHGSISVRCLRKDDGSVDYFVALVQDITDRKRAEEEKRKLQDHLRHSQKMEAVGQLAAGVAHEFNNILVGILANAELLSVTTGDDLSERFKRPLRHIERAGARAADLTKQLLSFARKKSPNVSLFDINQAVTDNKGMLQRIVGGHIALDIVLAPGPTLVRADEAAIEQAIINLAMNARDAMPDGGTFTIRIDSTWLEAIEVSHDCKPGPYVRLSVVDDGCGMPPEVVERVFEPFFTTKPVGEGTGLGLSTVFADITNSGGFISVKSRLGEGTKICVHLPQVEGVIETVVAGAEQMSPIVGGDETILICDDEEIVLNSIASLLETLGYTVIRANGPRAAIEAAAAHEGRISLLLTDVTMPQMDGIELAREFTKLYPDIRVVLTSGYTEDVPRARTGKNEPFDFIQKPALFGMMAHKIRDALDR